MNNYAAEEDGVIRAEDTFSQGMAPDTLSVNNSARLLNQ